MATTYAYYNLSQKTNDKIINKSLCFTSAVKIALSPKQSGVENLDIYLVTTNYDLTQCENCDRFINDKIHYII